MNEVECLINKSKFIKAPGMKEPVYDVFIKRAIYYLTNPD